MSEMEGNFLEGNGIIILLLFFLMFGWGGNGFGGNAFANGALTRAEMNDGFNMAELQRNQADIKTELCGINTTVMQNRYDTTLQIQQLGAQMATNCCDLKTAIHAEGEATRALIQQNQIEELKSELALARNVATNQTQTQNILSSLGRYVPYSGCNSGCGCI